MVPTPTSRIVRKMAHELKQVTRFGIQSQVMLIYFRKYLCSAFTIRRFEALLGSDTANEWTEMCLLVSTS